MNFLFLLSCIYTNKTKKRLDKEIIPIHYDLKFNITPEKFEGSTVATVKTSRDTNNIILNAKDLNIQSVKVENKDEVKVKEFTIKDDLLKISLAEPLRKDETYKLTFNFHGKYSDEMDGIYKSSYNGKPLYSTQFEPTSARKAFPCFDQPDMKATFSITIKAPENHTVLSNSSLDKKEGNSYLFNYTKPMSTYLVAFVVGQLEYIQASTSTNIPIAVYADKSDIKNGKLALDVAKFTLDFFQDYFQINYPFPKLDLVAIPEFAMGAMENWGLVTFRKTSLLFNPKTDAVASKLNVIETVCHELAHMWFGNFVTMNWWNDLWLNEGFATWASVMAFHNLPKSIIDFDIWTNFVNSTLEDGMEYDALHSSHPIAVEVQDPNEINQIFDKISYNKGASLIRMIENYVGHKNFRKGIQNYLNHFKYSNSESDDFFGFQYNSQVTTKMAQSWLNQKGFPLIKVEEKDKNLIISQKRFLSGEKKDENKLWIVPITIKFENENPKTLILDNQSIKIPMTSDIYKLNISNVGFYRVLYGQRTFERIFKKFDNNKERLNIINDLFALAYANYVDINWVVNFLTSSSIDYDYETLNSILSGLRKLCRIYYEDKKIIESIKKAIKNIIEPYILEIDLEKNSEDITAKLFNSLIVSNALFVGNQNIKDKLKKLFIDFKTGEKNICPDYIYPMMVSVVDDNLDDVINIAKNSILSNIRIMAMRALGAAQNVDNIKKVLNLYSELDRQDISYYYFGLSKNISHQKMIISFFIDNFDKISSYIINQSIINSSMSHVLSEISDSKLASQISNFVKKFSENLTVQKIIETNEIFKNFKEKNPKITIKY
ncbi:endoplasmic reticulum aminopeptidase 1 [Vairimorpha necatrix]|uniref:Aminopeptidase n=1 Tax=Vairimorpha necatrix TaxID=6039 RepID=A0AAX4JCD3_9MICR